jgi:hypothetical protein
VTPEAEENGAAEEPNFFDYVRKLKGKKYPNIACLPLKWTNAIVRSFIITKV